MLFIIISSIISRMSSIYASFFVSYLIFFLINHSISNQSYACFVFGWICFYSWITSLLLDWRWVWKTLLLFRRKCILRWLLFLIIINELTLLASFTQFWLMSSPLIVNNWLNPCLFLVCPSETINSWILWAFKYVSNN